MAHTIGQPHHVAGAMQLTSNYGHENFLRTEKKEVKVPLTIQSHTHLLCMQNCPVITLSPLPLEMNIYKEASGTTTSFSTQAAIKYVRFQGPRLQNVRVSRARMTERQDEF